MPLELINDIKLKRIYSFEELCKAMKVDAEGRPHREVKIFAWEEQIRALVKINRFYYKTQSIVCIAGHEDWTYNFNDEDPVVFIEDLED